MEEFLRNKVAVIHDYPLSQFESSAVTRLSEVVYDKIVQRAGDSSENLVIPDIASSQLQASLAAESSKGFTQLSGILIQTIRSREIDHIAIQLANSIPIR
jgi:hypothetical protein